MDDETPKEEVPENIKIEREMMMEEDPKRELFDKHENSKDASKSDHQQSEKECDVEILEDVENQKKKDEGESTTANNRDNKDLLSANRPKRTQKPTHIYEIFQQQ